MTMDQVYKESLAFIYNIAPNETKTLDFTFDHTAPQGLLEFSCHYGGHWEAGMHQQILVNAAEGKSVSPYPNNGMPTNANAQAASNTSGKCDAAITTMITNNAFNPTSVSIKKGATLTVQNTGHDSYTLTTTPDAGIRYTVVDAGETEHVAFPNAGTYTLSSQEHPEAKLTVQVADTAGTTCGSTPTQVVSFDANYANTKTDQYFFTLKTATIKEGQSITLSNLSDYDLTFISTPDAGLGNIKIDKNEHQDLTFKDNGTYTISCPQFPNEKFTITVQDAG